MNNVIDLDAKRKTLVRSPRHDTMRPRYYCTRCNTDLFHAMADGSIHCADCGILMSNIRVTESALASSRPVGGGNGGSDESGSS